MVDQKKAEATTAEEPKKAGAGKPKPRSPGYPAIDLKTALDKAKALYAHIGRHETSEGSVYAGLGYPKGRSGTSVVILAALKAYGLLESNKANGHLKLSPTALRILLDQREDDTERRASIRVIASRPAMHQYMWEKYGADLPADSAIEYDLVFEKGFTDSGAKQFVAQYKATLAFSGPPDGATIPSDPPDEGEEVPMNPPMLATLQKTLPPSPATPGMREVPIPIAASSWPSIKASFPMSEAAWTQMIAVLTAMKGGLVLAPEASSAAKDDKPRE